MTTSFDTNIITKLIDNLISRNSHAINKRVYVNMFNLLRILSENFPLNANQFSVQYDGTSWWSMKCDVSFIFKLQGSEITIVSSHRDFYEFRFRKYNPAVVNTYQFLTFEEDKIINMFRKYYNQYKINSAQYIHKMGGYVIFQNNSSLYKMFDEICNELEQHAEVVGFKDHRYNVSEYIDQSFRATYNDYKYNVAFKKHDKLVFILVNNSKHSPVHLASMMMKLEKDKVLLESKKDNVNYQDIQLLLDYLNN